MFFFIAEKDEKEEIQYKIETTENSNDIIKIPPKTLEAFDYKPENSLKRIIDNKIEENETSLYRLRELGLNSCLNKLDRMERRLTETEYSSYMDIIKL